MTTFFILTKLTPNKDEFANFAFYLNSILLHHRKK